MTGKNAKRFKIYSVDDEYIASAKYPIHAATLIGINASGTVRDGHKKKDIIWNEGFEEFSAAESYHGAALIMVERIEKRDNPATLPS